MSRAHRCAPAALRVRQPDPDGDDSRWAAVAGRERAADGAFCYGVLTTGVYSRPSCAARAPDRHNVVFFTDPDQARDAGFRPCLRCRPDETPAPSVGEHAALDACRSMERPGRADSLDTLAALSGFSRFHFHRLFTATIGVTPAAYATVCRAEHLRRALARTRTVTDAIYQCGFNSTGTFYARAHHLLGMTPTAFRDGGRGVPIHYAVVVTPERGPLLAAATGTGLCCVLSGPDGESLVRRLHARYPAAPHVTPNAQLAGRLARATARTAPRAGTELPPDIRNRALEGALRQNVRPPART